MLGRNLLSGLPAMLSRVKTRPSAPAVARAPTQRGPVSPGMPEAAPRAKPLDSTANRLRSGGPQALLGSRPQARPYALVNAMAETESWDVPTTPEAADRLIARLEQSLKRDVRITIELQNQLANWRARAPVANAIAGKASRQDKALLQSKAARVSSMIEQCDQALARSLDIRQRRSALLEQIRGLRDNLVEDRARRIGGALLPESLRPGPRP